MVHNMVVMRSVVVMSCDMVMRRRGPKIVSVLMRGPMNRGGLRRPIAFPFPLPFTFTLALSSLHLAV